MLSVILVATLSIIMPNAEKSNAEHCVFIVMLTVLYAEHRIFYCNSEYRYAECR